MISSQAPHFGNPGHMPKKKLSDPHPHPPSATFLWSEVQRRNRWNDTLSETTSTKMGTLSEIGPRQIVTLSYSIWKAQNPLSESVWFCWYNDLIYPMLSEPIAEPISESVWFCWYNDLIYPMLSEPIAETESQIWYPMWDFLVLKHVWYIFDAIHYTNVHVAQSNNTKNLLSFILM